MYFDILKNQLIKKNKLLVSFYVFPIVFSLLLSLFTSDYSNPMIAFLMFLFIWSLVFIIGGTFIFVSRTFKLSSSLFTSITKEIITKIVYASLILVCMYLSLYITSFILEHLSRGVSIYGMYNTLNNYGLGGTLMILFVYTFMFCLQLLFVAGFSIALVRRFGKLYKRIFQILVFIVLIIALLAIQIYLFPNFIQEQELGMNVFYIMTFVGEINNYLDTLFIQTILATIVVAILSVIGVKTLQRYS
ncbi:hypothetical protein [Breznakia pachnodae]|uniref:ABC transporter permease n=1 Tax=Breznakia pachnodae TaxID=265178 RepID=A0ABU0DXQ4_9FIRM|nr:hypothetical protein [Breznakia pachnodae]MDQ0359410.1 hypothetical protein [Breznakia pachnodae]